ncbi:MAG: hypothetical protein K2Y71_29580 [Xanthobacteraceae bacterium]|nr:hypothetical protein [Xanthobacteraceae bacterium]
MQTTGTTKRASVSPRRLLFPPIDELPMWGSRIPLDDVERTANLYTPFVNLSLIYCWMFGALIPIYSVTLVLLLLHEAALYFGDVFAGQTPTPFGTITAHSIGSYFSGQLAFYDLRLFAKPTFLLRVVVTIGGTIWLIVRLLRGRFGLPEMGVFLLILAFNASNVAMTLAGLAPRAIEQLLLPLTEQGAGFELLEALLLLGVLSFAAWVAFHALRSFLKVDPLLPWQTQVCADVPAGSGWGKVALRMVGAPKNIGIADRKLRTALLMYFANVSSLVPLIIVFGTVPVLVFALVNFVKLMAGALDLKRMYDQVGDPMPLHFWLTPPYQLMLSIGVEALKAGVLLGLAYFLRRRAFRYLQTSIGLAQHRDQRPPVLFLRPFITDTIPLASPPINLLGRILSVPVLSSSLDAVVVDEGSELGPVVAVGDPGEPLPSYGASRDYFQHQDWQHAVARLAAEAQTIVLVMGRSEGAVWEMNLVATAGHLHKTLFVMPPDATDDDWRTALAFFEGLGVKELDRSLFCAGDGSARLIAAWVDENWRYHQLCSAAVTSTSFRLALRTYMRCVRHGVGSKAEQTIGRDQ